jgi:hypothetical protein
MTKMAGHQIASAGVCVRDIIMELSGGCPGGLLEVLDRWQGSKGGNKVGRDQLQ